MLTDGDREMIYYFHKVKGDITAWAEWDKKKVEINKIYPELFTAMDQLKFSKLVLDAIVDKICNDTTGEE